MKKITIDPRVIKHLGKDLITSSEVAVIELIKNSIDAGASHINLRLYSNPTSGFDDPSKKVKELVPIQYFQEPFLIIEDNGKGMTDYELEHGFLTIGTNIKVNEEHSLGEKGIGRLAAQRLGSALLVETSSSVENHTSYVYLDWEDIVNGAKEVPSGESSCTPHHTKLWIFGINLEDYIDNVVQFRQTSLLPNHSDVNINRDLKSALNFLVSPFSNTEKFYAYKKSEISFYFDGVPIDIRFPENMLALAESKHYFSFESGNSTILNYGLNIEPWFIERVHRALVKSEAFKRLKQPHDYYADLLRKNKSRIENALTGTLNQEEILARFYEVLSDFYGAKGDSEKLDLYDIYLTGKAKQAFERLQNITPISGEIFGFKQGAAIGDKIIIDAAFCLKRTDKRHTLNELKYFLEDYNGIKLYRGLYRIGFLGNKESDWIKLQQFRTKGQQWYRFDLGNTLGFVSLSDDAQINIQEISSRLDISENESSEAFKLLINIVFNYIFYDLNRKANDLIRVFLAEEGLLDESIAKRVKKNDTLLKEMMARNKSMQKALANVSQNLTRNAHVSGENVVFPTTTYHLVTETLDSISDNAQKDQAAQETTALLLSEADAQLKAIEVESYNNYKLMANGLITETITHELHSLSKTGVISNSQEHFDALKEYFVRASAVKTYNQHIPPIQNSYNSIANKLEQVGDLYSFLETTFIKKGAYDVLVNQNIKDAIDDIKQNLLGTIKKEQIEIICQTGDLSWIVPKGVLLHVFYNLINNSLYWIDVRRKRAQSDSNYITKHDDRIVVEEYGSDGLLVYDTGTGVSNKMEDLLFEPLQSGKPLSEGRGMGLYIVKKLLQSFGGGIELLDERNSLGNKYKFLIVANTEEEV